MIYMYNDIYNDIYIWDMLYIWCICLYIYMGYNVGITQHVMIRHHFVYQNGRIWVYILFSDRSYKW